MAGRTTEVTVMWKPILIAALALAPACSERSEHSERSTPHPDARGVEALGIQNAVRVDERLVSTGQPTPEQLAALPGTGFRHVIHLRPVGEEGTGWEEARAGELGLRFVRLPVAGPEDLTEANARALDRELAAAGESGVVLSCSSGNRCGGLLALRAFYCQGASPEEALALGKRAGMTRAEPAVRKALGLAAQ